MRTLLLTAAGTLALSTAAFADVATYTIENGIYTFTTSGTCPVDLDYNTGAGITLNTGVELYVDRFFFATDSKHTLTLNEESRLISNSHIYLHMPNETIVEGHSKMNSVTSIEFEVLTLNAGLTVTATDASSGIYLLLTTTNINLNNRNSETSFLTLDSHNLYDGDSDVSVTPHFNLQFSGVLTGDYKLVTLRNEAINTEANRTDILNSNFKLNNTAMTDTEKANLRWDGNTLVYSAGAVPEPSLFGVLAGLGALALAGTRRRRK